MAHKKRIRRLLLADKQLRPSIFVWHQRTWPVNLSATTTSSWTWNASCEGFWNRLKQCCCSTNEGGNVAPPIKPSPPPLHTYWSQPGKDAIVIMPTFLNNWLQAPAGQKVDVTFHCIENQYPLDKTSGLDSTLLVARDLSAGSHDPTI